MIYWLIFNLFALYGGVYGTLAGGRPNSFSGGQNAFAGVVNPANAVWLADRFDLGSFWVYQKSSLNNHDHNRFFPPGKTDFTYKSRTLLTLDAAIHKKVNFEIAESSFTLAAYTMPSYVSLRTKQPILSSGTTPIILVDKTNVISLIFSFKLGSCHSAGVSVDYLYFSHRRDGYQNSDNPLRSVSPGHVTNNGMDHSNGIGFGIGWRWKITKVLDFGAAWTRKSYGGQYRKYRGFEPHHAKNYTPQTVGAGFSYRFTPKISGRLEALWSHLGNLPKANNNVLPNGSLNLHKRGSNKSPGPGLRDATYLNIGLGYQVNALLSLGAGFSHRLKFRKSSNIASHTYILETIYNTLSFGANLNYRKHDLFLSVTYGFRNKVSGYMPSVLGGGRFTGKYQNTSISISWGYNY